MDENRLLTIVFWVYDCMITYSKEIKDGVIAQRYLSIEEIYEILNDIMPNNISMEELRVVFQKMLTNSYNPFNSQGHIDGISYRLFCLGQDTIVEKC